MTQLRPNPRTVDIIGVYTTDPTFFGIIMQYLPNGSLRGILYTRGDAITSKLQFTWAKDIAIGMAYLHEEGVLHRDLKTQNVLLTNDWRCKITDFGVSQCPALKTAVTRQSIRGDTKKTPGTVLFKAPEAWSSKNTFTTKSDVYSYAIVLWEIWDRGDPWDNMDECEIMHAVCIDQARPEVPDVMPVEVRALMCRAWSQEVASRPDFKDIVTQLRDSGLEFSNPTTFGFPVLCRCLAELSEANDSEWVDASLVREAYFVHLGRDSDMFEKIRDSANESALIQVGRKNEKSGALEVVPSMKAAFSREIYYRLMPKGRGLLES